MMTWLSSIVKKFSGNSSVIVVSGLPRSGTSLMMQMLHSGGLEPISDNIRMADVDNPKGYYEFERAKDLPQGDYAWLESVSGKVVKIISTLLIYLPQNHKYKILFMRRNIDEVMASQARMIQHRGTMRQDDDESLTKHMLEVHLEDIEAWIKSHSNVSCLYVSFNDLFVDPDQQIDKIVKFLGMNLNQAAMRAEIKTDLYRNRMQ